MATQRESKEIQNKLLAFLDESMKGNKEEAAKFAAGLKAAYDDSRIGKEVFADLTIIKTLIEKGYTAVLTEFIKNKPEILGIQDANGYTGFIWAAKNGRTETAKVCIDADKKVLEQKDKYGNTGFIWAAYNGHTETAKVCIDADKKVLEQKDNDGNIGFFWAACNGHTEIAKVCIAGDKKVLEQKDNDGYTGLFYAGQNEHKEIVECINKVTEEIQQQSDHATQAINEIFRNK